MSVRITYFTHSTTADNEQGIASGWSDVPLSELGMQQSKELALKVKDKQFDAVFASDLRRTAVTAATAWGATHSIIHDRRLRECNYGDYNGKPAAVVEPLQEKYIHTPFPNGESCVVVEARIKSFLDDLRRSYDGRHVAVVSHKLPQLALEVLIRGMTWPEAFANDWRKSGAWQPGWEYVLDD